MMLQVLVYAYLRSTACRNAAGTHPGPPPKVRVRAGRPGNWCVFVHTHHVHGLGTLSYVVIDKLKCTEQHVCAWCCALKG